MILPLCTRWYFALFFSPQKIYLDNDAVAAENNVDEYLNAHEQAQQNAPEGAAEQPDNIGERNEDQHNDDSSDFEMDNIENDVVNDDMEVGGHGGIDLDILEENSSSDSDEIEDDVPVGAGFGAILHFARRLLEREDSDDHEEDATENPEIKYDKSLPGAHAVSGTTTVEFV